MIRTVLILATASAATFAQPAFYSIDTDADRLVGIDTLNPARDIGPLGFDSESPDLAILDGVLYLLEDGRNQGDSRLFTVDTQTGAATLVATVEEQRVEGLAARDGQLIVSYSAIGGGRSPLIGTLNSAGGITQVLSTANADLDGLAFDASAQTYLASDSNPNSGVIEVSAFDGSILRESVFPGVDLNGAIQDTEVVGSQLWLLATSISSPQTDGGLVRVERVTGGFTIAESFRFDGTRVLRGLAEADIDALPEPPSFVQIRDWSFVTSFRGTGDAEVGTFSTTSAFIDSLVEVDRSGIGSVGGEADPLFIQGSELNEAENLAHTYSVRYTARVDRSLLPSSLEFQFNANSGIGGGGSPRWSDGARVIQSGDAEASLFTPDWISVEPTIAAFNLESGSDTLLSSVRLLIEGPLVDGFAPIARLSFLRSGNAEVTDLLGVLPPGRYRIRQTFSSTAQRQPDDMFGAVAATNTLNVNADLRPAPVPPSGPGYLADLTGDQALTIADLNAWLANPVDANQDGAIDPDPYGLDAQVFAVLLTVTGELGADCNRNNFPDVYDIGQNPALDVDLDGAIDGCLGCSLADVAEPFDELAVSDVLGLLAGPNPVAASPFDVADFFDVVELLRVFDAGCP